MARQQIVWTVLPHGRIAEGKFAGRWCVSLVASPRLTPEKPDEQLLGAFKPLLAWPETLRQLGLGVRINGKDMQLEPLALPEDATWRRLFSDTTPVAGFRFKDMSKVNLRSFAVRNVLGFARRHYGRLATASGEQHPALLPYGKDSPLIGLLSDLGTAIDERGTLLRPGFERFHPRYEVGNEGKPSRVPIKEFVVDSEVDRHTDRDVFGPAGCMAARTIRIDGSSGAVDPASPVRALPPDWQAPGSPFTGTGGQQRKGVMAQFATADEYSFYQADRFYRRRTPTAEMLRMRRPDQKNVEPTVQTPEYDFHRIVASYGDHPALMRMLGLVIDCVLPEGTVLDAATDAVPLTGRMLPLVRGDGASGALEHVCLQTAWQATGRRFVAAARSTDHERGLLALDGVDDRHERTKSMFDVYQVDPDGTALKTVDYLLTAQNLVGRSRQRGADGGVTYTTGDAQPVAALRSAGLGISRHGRAQSVAVDARAAALKNAAIEESIDAAERVVLFAEDVLRGYRVDVQEVDSGRWLSLCERTGRYRMLSDGSPLDLTVGSAEGVHHDEGYVKAASTTSSGTDDDHYLHESLFRWAGWSMVAPRPGRSLVAEHEAGQQTERAASPGDDVEDRDIAAAAERGDGLDVRFVARKGSLPKLRFGTQYRFRARIVDLAGNSLEREDRDIGKEEQASEPVQFARFEPVGPPALVQQERLSEGESLERMVIRSNFDAPADSYTAQWRDFYTPPPAGSGLPDFAYPPVNLRHVVPPKAAQSLCEQHGCFDAAMGGSDAQAVKRAYAVASRESGSLVDARPDAQVELITPQSRQHIATVSDAGALIMPPDRADATRDRFAAGQYVVHREALIPIPYLPDPAAGGIALHGVPGLARMLAGAEVKPLAPGLEGVLLEQGVRAARLRIVDRALVDIDQPEERFRWVLLIDFDTDTTTDATTGDAGWPEDRQSLCIALHDQPDEVRSPACGVASTPADPPKWDGSSRTLHVFLPQGRIARLQYASFVHDRYVGHLGLPQWVGDPGGADQVRAAAMAGAHWMVTPFRRLVLVHATQQPVCTPLLKFAYPVRRIGGTSALLFGKGENIALHGPSTGQFEVLAEWSEWVDDPAQDDPNFPGPRRVRFEGALGEIRLAENHPNLFSIESAVEAQRRIDSVSGPTSPEQMKDRADAAGNKHEFGDTRFRWVRYRLRAATRFREYLPPALYEKPENVGREGPPLDHSRLRVVASGGLGIEGDPGAALLSDASLPDTDAFGLVVPSSAPPDAPRIVYTLPTFRWTRTGSAADSERTSLREGNALRVYLDRPWFSSGDGEMLAVVVAAPTNRKATPFTQIGASRSDRVTQWGIDPLWDSRLPGIDAEPADFALRVAEEQIDLPGDLRVMAVAHRVMWSDDRQLWYCDIEIATGASYMPFVRLALARYQPNALFDAKLSPIVLADFAQLLPVRRAVLQRNGTQVVARLHGPAPARGPMRNRFRAGDSADSPYATTVPPVLPVPPQVAPAGMTAELGDNRVELVLQTRDPAIESDLAWRDAGVLASGPAQPKSGTVFLPRKLIVGGTDAVTVPAKGGRTLRFDRTELREGVAVDLLWRIDPAIWEQSATLPADAASGTSRLVLREFERYYSDRSVSELRLTLDKKGRRRRVVEERLVYTEFFDL